MCVAETESKRTRGGFRYRGTASAIFKCLFFFFFLFKQYRRPGVVCSSCVVCYGRSVAAVTAAIRLLHCCPLSASTVVAVVFRFALVAGGIRRFTISTPRLFAVCLAINRTSSSRKQPNRRTHAESRRATSSSSPSKVEPLQKTRSGRRR